MAPQEGNADYPPGNGSKSSKLFLWVTIGVTVTFLTYLLVRLVAIGIPQTYEDHSMHFKYGSIGSDNLRRGIPYDIWQVLPGMFPQYLPLDTLNLPPGKPKSYEAFGLITDKRDEQYRQIGFSKRWHLGVGDVVGINCAFCHVSTVRRDSMGPPEIILGMPANTVDAEAFFRFLFAVSQDPELTPQNVLTHIAQKRREQHEELGYWEEFIKRWVVIPMFIRGVKNLNHTFSFLDRRPTPFGPGRVDTWAAYKVLRLQEPFWFMEIFPELFGPYIDMDAGSVTGLADFPALWKEKADSGAVHWDGNNRVREERNITAALGAGATPATLDIDSLRRVGRWMESDLTPRAYETLAPEGTLVTSDLEIGSKLFKAFCFGCHAEEGKRISQLEHIDVIGTDRKRLDAFTPELSDKLNEIHHLSGWRLENYWKTQGYANLLLTGIWLRSPYLHNGSVPTLWHLLQKPENRPSAFCRGNDVYDWKNVGFAWEPKTKREKDKVIYSCDPFHYYDTTSPGNGNGGHVYGTSLQDWEKRSLIEYLKTL